MTVSTAKVGHQRRSGGTARCTLSEKLYFRCNAGRKLVEQLGEVKSLRCPPVDKVTLRCHSVPISIFAIPENLLCDSLKKEGAQEAFDQ